MLKGLAGKAVVVTGAAAGIGEACCHRLVEEGARVVAADIDSEGVGMLAKTLGSSVAPLVADASTASGAAACVETAVSSFGRLDLFHSNAGVEGMAQPVVDFDEAIYDRVFDVNVRGAFLCAQAAIRQFDRQGEGGGLLFTASLSSLTGTPNVAVYNASKHALHGLVRCLAKETGPGIRVNMLAPGVVDTRMIRSLEDSMGAAVGIGSEGMKTAMEQSVPLGRYATADEIAAAAVWLLSDEVPYMHGEVVTVGGGLAP